jgi:hypothetical protein
LWKLTKEATLKTIYKYPLKIADKQNLTNDPIESILNVGLDPSGNPCIWALVDTDLIDMFSQQKIGSTNTIYVIGSGYEVPKDAEFYIGSFVDGAFVWHVWK